VTTRIHCARSPEGEGESQTVDVSAYQIWLVKLCAFNHDPRRARLIEEAVTGRLRDIFTRIAAIAPRGRREPRAIDLVWASIAELSARRPNECIVYFVASYSEGLIHPFASRMAGSSSQYASYYRRIESIYSGHTPPHAGLTIEDLDAENIRMLSEVHVDRMLREFPHASESGLREEEEREHCRRAGVGIGGMAFHELMHNVIDRNEGENFELHDHGGIADIRGHSAEPVQDNLERFRRYMFRTVPEQIVPSGRPPGIRTAPARASRDRSGGSGAGAPQPDLSGLEGL